MLIPCFWVIIWEHNGHLSISFWSTIDMESIQQQQNAHCLLPAACWIGSLLSLSHLQPRNKVDHWLTMLFFYTSQREPSRAAVPTPGGRSVPSWTSSAPGIPTVSATRSAVRRTVTGSAFPQVSPSGGAYWRGSMVHLWNELFDSDIIYR